MAQDNVLGIQATINGKDIKQGADEFIGQISRMEQAADRFVSELTGKSKMVNGQIESIGVSFDSVVKTISKGAAALGIAFSAQQFVTQVAKTRGEFQQLEIAFNTMLGSAEKASVLMEQITKTAVITPFGLQDVANGAKGLLAYGVEAEKVNDTLVRLGDIASGLSIPLNDLIYLYGTTMTQGKLFTQDLRQFQGRGIPLADELAKQFGVTKDKVGELVTAGKVGFANLEQAIISMTSEGGKFGGLMEAQSKSIIGQWSNIKDNIQGAFNSIGKSQEGVINTALDGVALLVENYEAVGRSILALVASYGTYKAALITTIVLHKSWAVAARVDATAKAILTAATKAQTVAQLALNSAMKANPYVLLATAVVGLGTAMWALYDRTSAAEKANASLTAALEEQNEQHKKHKEHIDGLVASLGNVEISEGKRIENFQLLKQEYPKILENIHTETEFLAKKHEILQLINQEQGKQIQKDDEKQLYIEEAKLKRWIEHQKQYGKGSRVDVDGNGFADTNVGDAIIAQRENVNKMKAKVAQSSVESYLASIEKLKDADITSALEDVTNTITALGGAGENAVGIFTTMGMELSKGQLKTIKSKLEGEVAERNKPKKSAEDWLTQYKKEYDDATKALSDFMKKKNQLTEAQFAKQYSELEEKQKSAKKKYEDAGGSVKSDSKDVQEAERIGDQVTQIELKTEKERISLKEEGRKKRLAQIQLEKKEELAEVEKQRKEWKKAQGELTAEQERILKEREDIINEKSNKAEVDIYKDEAAAMRNFLKEYGTYQQQKLAITEEYSERIKKAQTEGEKLTLGKERDKALQEVEIASIKQQIDWGSIFGDFSTMFKEQLEPTIEKLKKITETDSFKSSSLEEQKIVYELINKLQASSTKFDGDIFAKVAEDMSRYQQALEKYNNVMLDSSATADELSKAQKELAEATSNLQSSSAQASNIFSQLQNSLRGLSSGSLEGIGNALMGLDKLFNNGEITSKVGTNLANGVTKLFGSDSKVTEKLTDALGNAGLIGELISAVLSIFDVLKDGIGNLVANVVDTILGTINTLLDEILTGKMLVTIGESLYRGIGSILNTLTFGGLNSWVGGGDSDKNLQRDIERLSISNENLRNALDELSKKLEEASIMDATSVYEEQRKNIEQSMKNTQEMMQRSAAASTGGFLGIGARHSTNYKINKGVGDSEWKRVSEITGVSVKNASDFFKLTSEQMAMVANEATDIYSKIEALANDGYKDASKYMDEYIQYYKQLEELENEWREKLTSSSFDSIRNDFKATLLDMEASTEDFAKSFEELMKNAIIESLMTSKYDKLIQMWYKDFAKMMEDGELQTTEKEALKTAWDNIVSQATSERTAMFDAMGFEGDTYSQEASTKGFQAMSQETGSELNGRFTALQIAGEEIRKQSEQQTALQALISTDTAAIKQDMAISKQYISEIVDIQYESVGYLSEISKNTKQLFQMNERLGQIEANTRNM